MPLSVPLSQLRLDLRAETGQSMNIAQGVQAQQNQDYQLARQQEELYLAYEWPHLQTWTDIPVSSGQQHYDYPATMPFDLVNRILAAAALPPVKRTVPVWVAYTAGFLLEGLYTLLRWEQEPPMTRFLARELATAHWFDISAARRDLGYEPAVSIDEGMRRLEQWLREKPVTSERSPIA